MAGAGVALSTTGARRDFASRRGSGRRSGLFLGSVVLVVSKPSRFGFAETLVPLGVPGDLTLSHALWSRGHGAARRSSPTLMAFSCGHF